MNKRAECMNASVRTVRVHVRLCMSVKKIITL